MLHVQIGHVNTTGTEEAEELESEDAVVEEDEVEKNVANEMMIDVVE